MALRALASINVAAIQRNTARLRRSTGHAQLCAVVKARGYGHGAGPAARAALAGGATMIAVATADEADELRRAGIEAPLLVMGAVSDEELPVALAAGAELSAWDERFVQRVAGAGVPVRLHVKLDTGMGRNGTRVVADAVTVAERIVAAPGLTLGGAMTHFATADGDPEFMRHQLDAFSPFVARLRERAPIVAHAANSAATIRDPATHLDMVRCGIALYGVDPFNADPAEVQLEPALELSSYVAAVKPAAPGQSAGYGRRFVAERDTLIATLPIGYADGIPRGLTNNCDVLIGGRRYPLAGTVSMDNVTVDVGPSAPVAVGERAVLIGHSGESHQTAEQLSHRLGTIAYEVLCGISDRVTRRYHRDGEPLA